MRRPVVIGAARRALTAGLGLLLAGSLVLGLSGCGSSGGYQVRAIFDDAGNVIPGEDVRVAGVTVGSVSGLSVTPDQKAAVVLNITNPGFQDFRADASCIVRPQSLIGEVYVECNPTQPRPEGAVEPPPLPVIRSGQPGAGEHYLPVTNTSSPVAIDLIGDVARLPYSQRLTIIVNELGAGLAGNSQALEEVVKRADPTLAAFDRVLAILAAQNHTLASLATESDTVIAPLAANREQVADFIAQSNTVATVTAQHRVALDATLAKLPGFLDALTPELRRLSTLAGQANPVLGNLAVAAPDLSSAIENLTPASQGATSYLTSLGQTAEKGIPQIQAAEPIVKQLGQFGTAAQPFAQSASQLLTSVKKQGGLQDLLDVIFRSSLAGNGYNADGHFLRVALTLSNPCIFYQVVSSANCSAALPASTSASAASAARPAGASASSPVSATAARASSSTTNTLLGYLLGN